MLFILLALLPSVATLAGLLALLFIVPRMWAQAEAPYTPGLDSPEAWAASIDVALGDAWFQPTHAPEVSAEAEAEAIDAVWTHLHWRDVVRAQVKQDRAAKAAKAAMARTLPVKGRDNHANETTGFMLSIKHHARLASVQID